METSMVKISLSLEFFDRNCKCQLETDANTAEKEATHPVHVLYNVGVESFPASQQE